VGELKEEVLMKDDEIADLNKKVKNLREQLD